MDKTSRLINRLIKWQRITIVALLLSLIVTGFSAASYRRSLRATEVQFVRVLDEDIAVANKVIAELDRRHDVHKNDQQLIHDLDERLRKYEARYGEIAPVRTGEGVYIGKIGKLGLKPQVDQ